MRNIIPCLEAYNIKLLYLRPNSDSQDSNYLIAISSFEKKLCSNSLKKAASDAESELGVPRTVE